jgi:hypothetical protein
MECVARGDALVCNEAVRSDTLNAPDEGKAASLPPHSRPLCRFPARRFSLPANLCVLGAGELLWRLW